MPSDDATDESVSLKATLTCVLRVGDGGVLTVGAAGATVSTVQLTEVGVLDHALPEPVTVRTEKLCERLVRPV